jgi:hypothetical protein
MGGKGGGEEGTEGKVSGGNNVACAVLQEHEGLAVVYGVERPWTASGIQLECMR